MIADVDESMRVFQEEIFGPVLVAMPFDDEADAIRLANATPYGLAAYVWTNDIRRAHRVAHAIDTGMCWINSQNVRDLRTPFGGVKSSGIGREGGDYAFEFYCDLEIVHVALGSHHIPRMGLGDAEAAALVTAAGDLVAAPPAQPPYDIVRAAWAELVVLDLAPRERFYVDLLGLIVSERTPTRSTCGAGRSGCITRSCCARARSPVCAASRSACARRTISTCSRPTSRRAAARRRPRRASTRGEGRALHVRDPFGFPLAFFCEMSQFDTQLQRFDLQHGAPVARIDHFNLHTPDVERSFAFWKSLGFRCTEYISTDGADERITGAWLARKPTVHDVALTAGGGPRLHHLGLAVPDTAGVMRACDQLGGALRGARSSAAPAATASRTRSSSTCAIPPGTASSSTPATTTPATPTTGRCAGRPNDARCRSFWGARAPDRWYNESSVCSGPTACPSTEDRRRRARSALRGHGLNNFRTQRSLSVLGSRSWERTTSHG